MPTNCHPSITATSNNKIAIPRPWCQWIGSSSFPTWQPLPAVFTIVFCPSIFGQMIIHVTIYYVTMNSFSNNNLGDHNNISLSVNHNTGEATKPSKSGNDDNTERETTPAIRVSPPTVIRRIGLNRMGHHHWPLQAKQLEISPVLLDVVLDYLNRKGPEKAPGLQESTTSSTSSKRYR